MRNRTFEALDRDRAHLLKALAELRAGKLRGVEVAEVPQLIVDLKKRIEALSREMGDDLT
jgi:hypothetical protein